MAAVWLTVLLLAVVAQAQQNADYQEAVGGSRGMCYKAVKDRLNAKAAGDACRNDGAALANFVDEPEFTLITHLRKTHRLQDQIGQSVWLDGDDLKKEGDFQFIDGTPFTFANTKWSTDNPDNYGGVEHCLATDGKGKRSLNDANCYSQKAYMCMKQCASGNNKATKAPVTAAPTKAPATAAPTKAPATAAPTKAPGNRVPSSLVPMYRRYYPGNGDHFFTANAREARIVLRHGWKNEGVPFKVLPGSDKECPRKVPLYRLFNPVGDHLYTVSKGEHDKIIRYGWKSEGIAGYIAPGAGVCGATKPLHRWFRGGAFTDHHYVAGAKARENLPKHGYRYEGVVGYVW